MNIMGFVHILQAICFTAGGLCFTVAIAEAIRRARTAAADRYEDETHA